MDLDYYASIAQRAERACYDSVFVADGLALNKSPSKALSWPFEPVSLLSAIAASTSRIGLIATLSTTYSDPFTVARAIASLDHLSKGRAGWNIVTTVLNDAAAYFGGKDLPEHADRYERADEFVEVVLKLWNGWREGAMAINRETAYWST